MSLFRFIVHWNESNYSCVKILAGIASVRTRTHTICLRSPIHNQTVAPNLFDQFIFVCESECVWMLHVRKVSLARYRSMASPSSHHRMPVWVYTHTPINPLTAFAYSAKKCYFRLAIGKGNWITRIGKPQFFDFTISTSLSSLVHTLFAFRICICSPVSSTLKLFHNFIFRTDLQTGADQMVCHHCQQPSTIDKYVG